MNEEFNVENWYAETTPEQGDITVAEIERLCQRISDQRDVVSKARDAYKQTENELDLLERTLVQNLTDLGKKSYASSVGRFDVRSKAQVRVPKDESRHVFFEYLKEKGIFEDLITVNSQTLNAWYKEQLRVAEEAGALMDFKIPGIEEPELTATLAFTRKK